MLDKTDIIFIVIGLMVFVGFVVFIVYKMKNASLSSGSVGDNGPNITVDSLSVKGNVSFEGRNTYELNIIPSGMIIAIMTDTIPTGWIACDGTNNTPDLRGNMLVGSGTTSKLTSNINSNTGGKKITSPFSTETNFAPSATGGGELHVLTQSEMPPHQHGFPAFSTNPIHNISALGSYPSGNWNSGQLRGNSFELTPLRAGLVPQPWTNVPSSNEAQSIPHNNMQPYYVIQYIMKK